jgi:endonuclease-3
VGIRPEQILAASDKEIARNLRLGGIFPEMRSQRLKEIAARVKNQYSGDLDAALRKPIPEARKVLKQFPTIGDPGADKILLFTQAAPVAAVPSNCVHVPQGKWGRLHRES